MASKGKKGEAVPVEADVAKVEQAPQIITGKSSFIFADNSSYEGDWMETNGQKSRHGHGSWDSDQMNGEGSYLFSSGATYKGHFKGNMFHGLGTFSYADGSSYKGMWQANKMHGRGEYTDKDQSVFTGEFVNGLYDSGRSYISLRPTPTI